LTVMTKEKIHAEIRIRRGSEQRLSGSVGGGGGLI
jgi:hypothetical protein